MSMDLQQISTAFPGAVTTARLDYAPTDHAKHRKWVRRGAWLIAFLAAFALLFPVGQYSLGYAVGNAEARAELAQKRATIYVYGYRDPTEHFDPNTGLHTKAIAGCVVTDWVRGRRQGHNGTIEAYVRRNGSLAYSRLRWSGQIMGIAAHFNAQSLSTTPTTLALSGAAARSPDGRFTLAIPATGFAPGAFPRLTIGVPSGAASLTMPCMIAFTTTPQLDILWGAPGSDIVFVRFSGATGFSRFHYPAPGTALANTFYAVLDLRDGTWLRCE